MKKILDHGSVTFYLVSDGNTGYLVLVDAGKIHFEHVVCCWRNPPTKEILSFIASNRGELRRIVMCSREGEGYYNKFGVDTCLREVSEEEASHIKARVIELLSLEEKEEARKVKERREKSIATAIELLDQLRYADAKIHCEIYGIDFRSLI